MPLEIRIVSDSEYRAVNDFFNNTRNINVPAKKTPRGYPEFCWEFIDGPAGKAIYAAAWEVEAGKEPVIVGIQGLIPLKMIASDGATFRTAFRFSDIPLGRSYDFGFRCAVYLPGR